MLEVATDPEVAALIAKEIANAIANNPAEVAARYSLYTIIVQSAATIIGAIIAGILTYSIRRMEKTGIKNSLQMDAQDVKLAVISKDVTGGVEKLANHDAKLEEIRKDINGKSNELATLKVKEAVHDEQEANRKTMAEEVARRVKEALIASQLETQNRVAAEVKNAVAEALSLERGKLGKICPLCVDPVCAEAGRCKNFERSEEKK